MRIVHYGHSCVLIDTGSARLLFDPGTFSSGFEDLAGLDAILITHQHADHLDIDRLPALLAANPRATLIADTASAAEEIAELNLVATIARPGDMLVVAGAAIDVVGGTHAIIHRDYPVPPNVGYVVDQGAFYHPGDALFVPEQKIDVLALPAGAPWMSTGAAVDFQRAVAPRVSVPIHESLLSEPGMQSAVGWFTRLAPKGTEVCTLTPLAQADL